jgi:hypothetical protein
MATSYFVYFSFLTPSDNDSDSGYVSIVLMDESNTIIIDDVHYFEGTVTLYELLQSEYDIACASPNYAIDYDCGFTMLNSHIILGIEEIETDWINTYLKIYINDEESNFGVDLIYLNDESEYVFIVTQVGGE